MGWFFKLPWGDPSLSAQVLAMLVFMLGGITGLINASFNVNQWWTTRPGSRATST